MNEGFKGNRVHIASVAIDATSLQGTKVKFRVLFEDADGLTHASVMHEVAVGEDDDFLVATRALVEACVRFAERQHFDTPNAAAEPQKVKIGIAEALGTGTDSADEPGEQG